MASRGYQCLLALYVPCHLLTLNRVLTKKTKSKPRRSFPARRLEEALAIAKAVAENNAGRPYNRLSLAESIRRKPDSSVFRQLLSASIAYGLTEGSEKSASIKLTELGTSIVMSRSEFERRRGLIAAARKVTLFSRLYEHFDGGRIPADANLRNLLIRDFSVEPAHADECISTFLADGRLVGLIRRISGDERVSIALAEESLGDASETERDEEDLSIETDGEAVQVETPGRPASDETSTPRQLHLSNQIFDGHGKNRDALSKLERLLREFRVPFKVAVNEPNLGRPIPVKVREIMLECTSGILMFTRDEQFMDAQGNELWRPSENVVFELGAASFQYADRVVILKEKGVVFPSNFSSVGYIEFELESFESKTMEIMRELIGLLKVTPA